MQQTKGKRSSESGFRPHVWGSFFMRHWFTPSDRGRKRGFRPHVWGSFFMKEIDALNAKMDTFSSPCLGIFFYR